MSDINWKCLVIVTATHGEKYLGWLPVVIEDPKRHLEDCTQARLPVRLYLVRNFISQISETPRGVGKLTLLMPIDVMDGPLSQIDVIPSSWYFPGDCGEECKTKVESLLEQAIGNETRMKAQAAGLHLTDRMPVPPTAGKP